MGDNRAKEIANLFDQWTQGVARNQANGSVLLTAPPPGVNLESNGFVVEELNRQELLEACIGLSRLLSMGWRTEDHPRLWTWVTNLSAGQRYTQEAADDIQRRQLFRLCCRTALIRTTGDRATSHAEYLLENASEVMVYLALPLLESLLRNANHDFVTQQGVVVKAFTADGTGYAPPGAKGKKNCSSVKDMLWLFHQQVAAPDSAAALQSVGMAAERLARPSAPPAHGFKVIYDWRNGTLHGGHAGFISMGAVAFQACVVVALDEFRSEEAFESRKAELNDVEWAGFGGPLPAELRGYVHLF